jgi:hypothetical protein
MPIPKKPKHFIYRGHRYRIVYKTMAGYGASLLVVKELRDRVYPNGVIKKTSDGRYAIGVRAEKQSPFGYSVSERHHARR